MNKVLETINKNRTAIIVIALVFVCTIIGVSYIIDIMFKAHLLQSPCDLCESYQAARNIPLNIEELNKQLNITEEVIINKSPIYNNCTMWYYATDHVEDIIKRYENSECFPGHYKLYG